MRVDDAIAAYIKLRDKKAEMAERHKEEMGPISEGMTKLENWLHRQMLNTGVDSFKADGVGTAFLQTMSSVTVKDWTAALNSIREEEEWSLLEARVSKSAVKDYLENKGHLPPGVELSEAMVVRVRR